MMPGLLATQTRSFLTALLDSTERDTKALAEGAFVRAYADRPQITLMTASLSAPDSQTVAFSFETDLLRDAVRVVAAPGQAPSAAFDFRLARGLALDLDETALFPDPPATGPVQVTAEVSASAVFQAAADQGIPLVRLTQDHPGQLDGLSLSSEARARITTALEQGRDVIVPSQLPMINGTARIAWFEVNPVTGETIGVGENGSHQGLVEYVSVLALDALTQSPLGDALKALANVLGALDARADLPLIDPLNFLGVDPTPLSTFGGIYVPPIFPFALGDGGDDIVRKKLALGELHRRVEDLIAQERAQENGSILSRAYGDGYVAELRWLERNYAQSIIDDPPIPGWLIAADTFSRSHPSSLEETVAGAGVTAGAVAGTGAAAGLALTGSIQAAWTSQAATSLVSTGLTAGNATIRDAAGQVVGTGAIALQASSPSGVAIALAPGAAVQLQGSGGLAFYGTSAAGLLASGDWSQYQAALSGAVELTLTTDALTLDGQPLPAGTYTISTALASLSGTGATSAPVFSGAVAVSVSDATVHLDSGLTGVTIAGQPLHDGASATLAGYNGSIQVQAGSGTDGQAAFDGTAANVIQAWADPGALAVAPGSSATLHVEIATSLAGTYGLSSRAPEGWTLFTSPTGEITVTPAPGTRPGVYPVRLLVQSADQLDFGSQTTIAVTVPATAPGLALDIEPDPVYSLPFQGALLPTAFRATIQNTGPAPDTFVLAFPAPPAGFTIQASAESVTIPAGGTGVIGVYLIPTTGLPAPGTPASFSVQAASTSDPGLSQTTTQSFNVPEVHGLTIMATPEGVNTIPGGPVSVTVTFQSVGNVPESALPVSVTASPGLTVSAIDPVSLAPGQSVTRTITLTPAASTPLGSTLQATITAVLDPTGNLPAPALTIPVRILVPGAAAVADAGLAAQRLGRTALADRLADLSTSLTQLVQDPNNPVPRSQVLASLDSVLGQLADDPFGAAYLFALNAARAAIAGASSIAEVQDAVNQVGDALGTLDTTLSDEVHHQFQVGLEPTTTAAQPGSPAIFDLFLQNTGDTATTYHLAVAGLPANVSAQLSTTTVTLQPGESIPAGGDRVTLSLTETGGALAAAGFTVVVTAEGAPGITRSVAGSLTVRPSFVAVTEVDPSPAFADPGTPVQVSARLLNAVNAVQPILVSYSVAAPDGQVVFQSSPVPATLGLQASLTTVNLGVFDTTGLALGAYTIHVVVTDAAGVPLAGSTGAGSLLVGSPVTASLASSPSVLPPGDGTVSSTLTVEARTAFGPPLSLLGVAATVNPGDGVAAKGTIAYVTGVNDISIVDLSDPSAPSVIRTFAGGTLTPNSYNIAQVSGNLLLVASGFFINSNRFNLLIYDVSDPLNPALVSNTPISYPFYRGMTVSGTTVYFPVSAITWSNSNHDIFDQSGDFLAVDISDPAHPQLADVLFDDRGAPLGSNHNVNELAVVNSQVAYAASTTATGGDTQTGVGRVLVVNTSDPANLSLDGTLDIPNTVQLQGIAVQGNRALVVGSTGGWQDFFTSGVNDGLTGNTTLTVLDITDPKHPQVLGTTLVTANAYPLGSKTIKMDVLDLGNGLFAASNTTIDGAPVILLVDASDPTHILTGSVTTSSLVQGIAVSGNRLFAATQDGLAIYDINRVLGTPITVSVPVPRNTGVDLMPGSFNIPPTQIISGAEFDTLVWNATLGSGATSLTLTWQSSLTGLQPGEARAVAGAGSVQFVDQGTSGAIPLAPIVASSAQVLGLDPASQTTPPGGLASYQVSISNPTSSAVSYALSVQGVLDGWVQVAPSVTVPAQGTIQVPLRIRSDSFASPARYGFTVIAAADTGYTGTVQGTLILEGDPVGRADPDAHGVVATLLPSQAVAGPGTPARFVVRVTNTGSVAESFDLTVTGLPPGVSAAFDADRVQVPPGASNFRDVGLILTPAVGTPAGPIPFTVSAQPRTGTAGPGSDSGTLNVAAQGVQVRLTPSAAAPGDTIAMTVTNTGSVSETFDLSLGGAAILAAALGASQVTLAPGASTVVPITTTSAAFATQGPLELLAIAAAHTNPAVQDSARAALAVGPTQGLDAHLDPDTKVLPAPGPASFLIDVTNLGNVEDRYTATIIGTTGAVSAQLVGLDGQPALTIPVFRLPGLASGVLSLRAVLADPGQGTVTVRIESLDHPGLATTRTATLTTETKSDVTLSLQPGGPITVDAGAETTITATIGTTTAGIPGGTVTFFVDGVAQDPVPVEIVQGNAIARFTVRFPTATPAGMPHRITASYSGDAQFNPSAPPLPEVEVNVVPPAGPRVVSLLHLGYHLMPRTIVLRFDQPMDPARAQDLRNYRLVGPRGVVPIVRADYDAASQTVTLLAGSLFNVHDRDTITVNGTTPTGLTDSAGHLLDGDGDGQAGGTYTGVVDLGNLVLGVMPVPRPSTFRPRPRPARPATPVPVVPAPPRWSWSSRLSR